MDEKNMEKKLFRLVESNYEYLEECAKDTIVTVNNLLSQMRYYHLLLIMYENLTNKKIDSGS